MLRCGQNEIRIRSARGSYMKYSANQGCISSFVVGRTGSECGLPMAVIEKLPHHYVLYLWGLITTSFILKWTRPPLMTEKIL